LGIKPLFYGENKGKLFFGSEMKAILVDKTFPRELDYDALASYFTLGYIPAPLSIFQRIRKLLPGHLMVVTKDGISLHKYWDLKFEPNREKDEEAFIEEFMAILEEAVKIRLMGEVPLGVFLSGGVDSSAVVALMSKTSNSGVNTFSIGFGGDIGGYLDEREYARLVANRYGTYHSEYEVLPEPEGLVETIIKAFDEPFADDSTIPSYFICKTAKEKVTVALSGLGGDEVFAGYERYLGFRLSHMYEKLPSFMREAMIRKFLEALPERADGHYTINHMKRFARSSSLPRALRYFGYISMLSGHLKDTFFAEPEKFKDSFQTCQNLIISYFNSSNAAYDQNSLDDLNRAFYCDVKTYLPDDILALTDRVSMQHALEVRVPFLDHKLMEFCATIPPELKLKWFRKKYLLKKALADLLPKNVIRHRKQGFASPMAKWLQVDLKPYVLQTLSGENLKRHSLFNTDTVNSILTDHFARREMNDKLIWAIVVFQKWFETYIA
jgi:asparagine synthase (glutamine-hydrolysing)